MMRLCSTNSAGGTVIVEGADGELSLSHSRESRSGERCVAIEDIFRAINEPPTSHTHRGYRAISAGFVDVVAIRHGLCNELIVEARAYSTRFRVIRTERMGEWIEYAEVPR